MTEIYGNLCSVVLKQFFGTIVQEVGDILFASTARTLAQILKGSKHGREETINALSVLIRYQLVECFEDPSGTCALYRLRKDEIMNFVRLPRYIQLIKSRYNNPGASIMEELVALGPLSVTEAIVQCVSQDQDLKQIDILNTTFVEMIKDNYLIRVPVAINRTEKNAEGEEIEEENVPKLHLEPSDAFAPPTIEKQAILNIVSGAAEASQAKDADIVWFINFNKFIQDLRDMILIKSVQRKLGEDTAECYQYILQVVYERTHPFRARGESNPFTLAEIRHRAEKITKNLVMLRFLDQHVTLLAEDSLKFIIRCGDMGGGQYVINFNAVLQELALHCAGKIITERHGEKAARIFRIIRLKKYIEQEDLQREAMVPSKDAKLLTYNLMQDHFINMKTIRTTNGYGAGQNSFHLFCVKIELLIPTLLDFCYKAMYNHIERAEIEKADHQHLIDKQDKLSGLVALMKARGESEEIIAELEETLTPPEREILGNIKRRLEKLSKVEIGLQENAFLFEMYMFHSGRAPNMIRQDF